MVVLTIFGFHSIAQRGGGWQKIGRGSLNLRPFLAILRQNLRVTVERPAFYTPSG
jgi:hypothetical protein